MQEHYDMSEYSRESGLYDGENKKVIGKFKDESPDEVIESFVAVRSKCYSFKTKNNVVQKAKGVSKVVVKENIRGIAVSRKRLGDCDGPMAV